MRWLGNWKKQGTVNDLMKAEELRAKYDEQFLEHSHTMLTSAVNSTRRAVDELLSESNNELFKTRRRIDAVGTLIPDVIIITDHNGIIDTISSACFNTFGADKDEYEGHDISKLFSSTIRECHSGYFKGQVKYNHEESIPIETVMISANGATFNAEFTVHEFEENGKSMFMGIIRDISLRKENEKKLRDAEITISNLINDASLGYVVFDLSGLIMESNQAFSDLIEFDTPADTIDFNFISLISDEFSEEFKKLLVKIMIDQEAHETEIELITNDMAKFINLKMCAYTNPDGETNISALCQDVTKQRSL